MTLDAFPARFAPGALFFFSLPHGILNVSHQTSRPVSLLNTDSRAAFLKKFKSLALHSQEAAAWAEEFLGEENWWQLETTFQAMGHFRNHQIDQAKAKLHRVEKSLDAYTEKSPTFHLVQRWYLSAIAYKRYLAGDLDGASDAMRGARCSNRTAISMRPFLVPLATQEIDYLLQMSRIARRKNDWAEVQERLRHLRSVLLDEAPLATLDDGREIFLTTIANFYSRLPLDEQHKRRICESLISKKQHLDEWNQLASQVYTLPDVVIPYP